MVSARRLDRELPEVECAKSFSSFFVLISKTGFSALSSSREDASAFVLRSLSGSLRGVGPSTDNYHATELSSFERGEEYHHEGFCPA